MRASRAEIVAQEIAREWLSMASAWKQPTQAIIKAGKETILSLVAQNLLDQVLGGIVVGTPGNETFLVAHRWRFAWAQPLLISRWPVTPSVREEARFILRLLPSKNWFELPNTVKREITAALPLTLAPSSDGINLPSRMIPVLSRRLPEGDYLILYTSLSTVILEMGGLIWREQ